MSKLVELSNLGQSIWYDYIKRSFLENGHLQELIHLGVRGVTSNPAIFEKAISSGTEYDDTVRSMYTDGQSPHEIYEAIAIGDVSLAADILRPVYDATNGVDGFVSLEVNPSLAADTAGTIAEGKRLYEAVGRQNLMIKVPATPEGIPAITQLISSGVPVNVTLIFSVENYLDVADAYISGLEKLSGEGPSVALGHTISSIASVASFFISRTDTAVDIELSAVGNTDLQGTIASANAKNAYARFQDLVETKRWQRLASQGAHVQRPLWASTGTKNQDYSDTLYIDGLIGKDTVNTVPPATLESFLDHGKVSQTITADVDDAQRRLAELQTLGINLNDITVKLQDDAVVAFFDAMQALISSIGEKCETLVAEK